MTPIRHYLWEETKSTIPFSRDDVVEIVISFRTETAKFPTAMYDPRQNRRYLLAIISLFSDIYRQCPRSLINISDELYLPTLFIVVFLIDVDYINPNRPK
jgi:hypothetical protein